MCGIVCGIKQEAEHVGPEIADGLKKVQYRGYDSWGIGLFYGSRPPVIERSLSREIVSPLSKMACNVGLGHTRWATHGAPSIQNTHPIKSQYGGVYVVHNGIVENVEELRHWLFLYDFCSKTDTDTEIIANYIERHILWNQSPILIMPKLVNILEGSSSFAFYLIEHPDKIFFVNMGQSLYVAPGWIVSDKDAFPSHINECYKTNFGDYGYITYNDICVINNYPSMAPFSRSIVNKISGYNMLAEIREQASLGDYNDIDAGVKPVNVLMYGCGSSYYAGMFGRYLFENISSIETHIEYATELQNLKFRFITPLTKLIAISQSGETKDVIEAFYDFIYNSSLITNNSESTLAKLAKTTYNINVGKEIGVAATKTFLGTCLLLKSMAYKYTNKTIDDHQELVNSITKILNFDMLDLTNIVKSYSNALILGSNYNYPIALEGALKLKEVAYIHAEGMLGSEVKHGPIALIDKNTVTIAIVNFQDKAILNNIREIKARGGYVVVIGEYKNVEAALLADYYITLEPMNNINFALSASVVLQLIAYHVAVAKGINPDYPRYLAKSVTV